MLPQVNFSMSGNQHRASFEAVSCAGPGNYQVKINGYGKTQQEAVAVLVILAEGVLSEVKSVQGQMEKTK
jgi:hypothetical protein